MDFCISLSTKQGNSGRVAVTHADWIMSLVFRVQERFFKVPDDNIDPLKPHFYIVQLRFTGLYIIFHISVQNIDCGY